MFSGFWLAHNWPSASSFQPSPVYPNTSAPSGADRTRMVPPTARDFADNVPRVAAATVSTKSDTLVASFPMTTNGTVVPSADSTAASSLASVSHDDSLLAGFPFKSLAVAHTSTFCPGSPSPPVQVNTPFSHSTSGSSMRWTVVTVAFDTSDAM